MKTGIKRRLTALALTAALMLSLTPAVLPANAKAAFIEEYAIEKLVAMSETGLSKIITGVDTACGGETVSSFVNTWLFENAGTAATVERIEALCEEILDRMDELEEVISADTSKIEEMIAKEAADNAIMDLNDAWESQVEALIPTEIGIAVEQYQTYFKAARQYGLNPIKANKDAADAAYAKLRDAFVDVYQAEARSYNTNAADLEAAMTTAVANNGFKQCVTSLIYKLNPLNSYNLADHAAMTAYTCLMYADDQYALVAAYLQKQLLTIGWVMLTYNELMAMQGDYITEHAGELDASVQDTYQGAKDELAGTNDLLLEKAADLMDREITFSPTAPAVSLKLKEVMKPEDSLAVTLRNKDYKANFTLDDLYAEDSVEGSLKTYLQFASHTDESYGVIQDKNNLAVKTQQTGVFDLVGVLTAGGTEFYYILQKPLDLKDLEHKYDIRGSMPKGDVHSPSCDWYNLRDWSFDFPASNTAEAVGGLFSQPVVLALNGNTARNALGEHNPYTGSQAEYIFTPTYQLDDDSGIADTGTSYADFTFLAAEEEAAGNSIPTAELSASVMQEDDGKQENDKAVYIVKRTDTDRTVKAVTQGDCTLELDVEQVKGRTAEYGSSVKQRFGNYLSVRFKANGSENLSCLYIKRYLDSDRTRYTLEQIVSAEDLRVLPPEADGYYYLNIPMPAVDSDILLTTVGEDVNGGGTAADFRQQKERLTALQKDAAVRAADVTAASVSEDGIASLTEQLRQKDAKTLGAFQTLLAETDRTQSAKGSYDSALSALAADNARVAAANDKLSGAWQYKVANYEAPCAEAADCFRTYVSCLLDGSDTTAAEAAYEAALDALAKTGDFRADSTANTALEKALVNMLRSFALTDETATEPYNDPNGDNPEYFETRLASLTVQAARAAYEAYPFTSDQHEMINAYLDAQLNEIAWLLLMYQDMVSRQDASFTGAEGYPSRVLRLAQLFLTEAVTAADSDMTFWADKDSRQAVTLSLSAYPARADVFNGSAPLEYRFRDAGYLSTMDDSDWKDMQKKGYEMHYDSKGSTSCGAEEIGEYNSFYLLPVLTPHTIGSSGGTDLRFFQVLSETHPLKTLEYKNDVNLGYDNHVPSTDYFNLMAQGYGDETKGSSVTETSLKELAGIQAFVNSGDSLKELLSPLVTTSKSLYLLVTPDTDTKVKWEGNGTMYVMLPMVDAAGSDMTYSYISSDDIQAKDGKMQDDQYLFLRRMDPGQATVTVTGTVSNPGTNGETAMGIAFDNAGYDPADNTVWRTSRDAEPGSSVHLRIKPGDGETLTSLSVQRYTKEDDAGAVVSTEVLADGDDFRYLDKDADGYCCLEVTVPYSWEGVQFVASTSNSGGGQNSSSGGGGGGGGAAAVNPVRVADPERPGSVAGIAGRISHGTVAAKESNAKAGDKVVLTLTPDEGYQVAGVTVTDAKGNAVAVTQNTDGTYAFTMPATAVTVTPSFEEITEPPAGSDISETFTDVTEDAWYHDAVQWAVEKGLMNGVADGTFAPNGTATRAMVVTMLWRLAGEPAASEPSGFTDVSSGAWYAQAVAWAAETGGVNGTSADAFSPNAPVTREQLAAILYRYVQAQGKGFTGAWMFPLDYSDAGDVSDWANEAMHWMTMHGIINGMGDGTLAPKAEATRAQIAAIFMRFVQELDMETDDGTAE